jgi:hypothetical protein
MVSGYVLLLMILIEYINVKTSEQWQKPINTSKTLQLFIAVLLGLSPGCAGTFAVVSLYTHNIIGFFSLLAATIATFGDEAFIIFSVKPLVGMKLILVLFIISMFVGFVFMKIKWNPHKHLEQHFIMHGDECCTRTQTIKHQIQKISMERALLLSIIFLIILNTLLSPHEHGEGHGHLSSETLVFILLAVVSLFIILTVPEHFLKYHIWEHVLKKHFVRLFLWSILTLFFLLVLNYYIDLKNVVNTSATMLLFLSILIGIIPVSGPHVLFFTLFLEGIIPFSVLLANSIVQEGHAGIPLIAENKKAFISVKVIKIILAIIVGLIGYYAKF